MKKYSFHFDRSSLTHCINFQNKSRNSSKEEKDKVGEKDDEIKSFLGNS